MRLHRFIGEFDLNKKIIRISDPEVLKQLKGVLRMKVGGQIILADGQMNEAVAQIKHLNKNFAELEIGGTTKNEKEPEIDTALYCSILKKENFELVVQKATEAGVKEIIPVLTQRTVKLGLREDRVQRIAKEAAEQSGRGVIPLVQNIQSFKDAIKQAKENYDVVFFFQPEGAPFIPERLKNSKARSAAIFIGPEGGWDEAEIETARINDLKVVGLGGLTLRSETAAIIATWTVANA